MEVYEWLRERNWWMKVNTHMKIIWILTSTFFAMCFTPIFGSVSSSSNRQNIFSNLALKRATEHSFPNVMEDSTSMATKSNSIGNIKKFLNMEFAAKPSPSSSGVVKAELLQKHSTNSVPTISRDRVTVPLNYIKKFLSWQFSPKVVKDTQAPPSSLGPMKKQAPSQVNSRSSTINSVNKKSGSRNNIENFLKVNLPQKVTRNTSPLNSSSPPTKLSKINYVPNEIPGPPLSVSKGRATFTINPFQQYSISSSITDKLFGFMLQNKDSLIKCSGLKSLLDSLRQQLNELANQNAEIIRKENLLITQNNLIQTQLNTLNNNVLQLTQNVAYLQNDVNRLINLG